MKTALFSIEGHGVLDRNSGAGYDTLLLQMVGWLVGCV